MTLTPLSAVLTVLLTLIGGLILAGILSWIRKARLIVLVPRLFSYSHLTDRGQLAEVTVFNRGFKTEEAVELSLSSSFQYNIVGSNSQDVVITKNKLFIDRVGPGDEVTVLLLVEGGTFSKNDISNCLSKETKGTLVTKLVDVPPTGPQRIGLAAFFIAIPVIFYLFMLGVDYVGSHYSKRSIEIHGWLVPNFYERISGLYQDFKTGQLLIYVGHISRKADIANVPIVVDNKTTRVIRYSVTMTTSASEKRIPSYERRISDVLVVPGRSSERSIKVVIPERSSEPSDNLIIIEVFLQAADGDSLKLTRTQRMN